MTRALILDLDNTIYPVSSIAADVFNRLFVLIDEEGDELTPDDKAKAKDELTRRPYHFVAERYKFSDALKHKGNELLKAFSYDGPMYAFEDYGSIRAIKLPKFLVTTGYSKLQWSKVKALGLEPDFTEIHIVDPDISSLTKKDVFADILQRHNYRADEVLVIGDDPESEIKAANELGIETFLFDPAGRHHDAVSTHKAADLKEVLAILS